VAALSIDRKRQFAVPPDDRQRRRAPLGCVSAIAVACAFAVTVAPAAAGKQGKPKPKPAETAAAAVGKEPFGQIPQGPLQIIISIDQQKLHLYSDGTPIAETLVATGVPDHPTPMGVFSVMSKERLHHSNLYSGAPMPFMQRITWSGVAIHQGVNLGHPASHGCVRMSEDFATRLWVLTRPGARVIIARAELRPEPFADSRLFVHKDKTASPAVAAAATSTTNPVKTAQTADADKTTDAATEHVGEAAADRNQPASVAAVATLDAAAPPPPSRSIELARAASKAPISIFISRKTKKIYVRQDFSPLFEAAIVIEHPEQRLGTHVFTALDYLDDRSTFRWNVVSLPGEQAKPPRTPETEKKLAQDLRQDLRLGKPVVKPIADLPPPQTPQQALARIDIPADVVDQISQLIVPGSSLILSDQGLGDETGEGTDFIVVVNEEPRTAANEERGPTRSGRLGPANARRSQPVVWREQ
jgi:L,D-transpeptidase catalytic domain